MDLRETGFGDMNYIYLAQEKGRWRALENKVRNLGVHKRRGIS
jgi:hypothetical protein